MASFIAFFGVLSFISLIVFAVLTYKKFKQNDKAQGMKFLKFTGISLLLVVVLMSVDNLLEKPTDSAKVDIEKTTVTVDKDEQAKQEAELKAKEAKALEDEKAKLAKEQEEVNEEEPTTTETSKRIIDTSVFEYADAVDVTDAIDLNDHVTLIISMNEAISPGLATQHVVN
ncbi:MULTISPECIES: hypothetical protein [unclassified Lysinibacillus]|uniref:hypothetical protein n=1 Tax=unclassified Lysinibacillus TaxID=2636778 RepID=UPI00380CDF3C